MNLPPENMAIDNSVLDSLRADMGGVGSAEFRELVTSFLEDAAVHLQALEQAAALEEAEPLKAEAHILKGSSSYFGARGIQDLCLQIETLASCHDLGGVKLCMDNLRKEFERVRQALEKEL